MPSLLFAVGLPLFREEKFLQDREIIVAGREAFLHDPPFFLDKGKRHRGAGPFFIKEDHFFRWDEISLPQELEVDEEEGDAFLF